ncbi:MAG TPA: GNAT family N-acetyltransferase [Allosphingosinicella sp.]
MEIRSITPDDRDLICHHRESMFRDSGRSEDVIALMQAPFREWLAPRLADGRYFGWVAEHEGRAVAGLGMMEIDWPPHPAHPLMSKRGYILNVYVEPEYRGQGIAKKLMAETTKEARRRDLQFMILHATAQGRPLYEALGWEDTAEMALVVPGEEA